MDFSQKCSSNTNQTTLNEKQEDENKRMDKRRNT